MQIRCHHIDHVQVCIPPGTEEAARAFYENILHFHRVQKPASLKDRPTMWFQNGSIELHVAVDPVIKRTKQHPAMIVEEIEAVRAHLIQHGIQPHEEPDIPDRKRFSFLDPFGNRIEFLEYFKDRKLGT
ncbi:MAG TPA: VOC family protein [Phycisphaerae bacterium]|jgi:catechol 2,3-dioxygenase-like lactoylglutathione lyase family enzyme